MILRIVMFIFFFTSLHNLRAESVAIDFLRSTGKIYSVVAVIVIIFIGLAIYLWRIDRKLTKLENQIKDE